MEKEIKISAKLYECRDALKSLFRDEYKSKLKPYIIIIKEVMKANKIEEIPALILISKTEMYSQNIISPVCFMAAIVELIKPSKD